MFGAAIDYMLKGDMKNAVIITLVGVVICMLMLCAWSLAKRKKYHLFDYIYSAIHCLLLFSNIQLNHVELSSREHNPE